jgi:hypothetical protein
MDYEGILKKVNGLIERLSVMIREKDGKTEQLFSFYNEVERASHQ